MATFLTKRESTAPAPPIAPKYTPLYCLKASFTACERAPLPIVPLSPSLSSAGELVHPPARGGANRPDDIARARRRGARVVDDLAADVDRQRLTPLDQRKEAPVRRVTRRVEHPGDPHAITGLQ